MKNSTLKVLAVFLALTVASSLSVAALANGTAIESPAIKNTAPIAENLEYETFRGVALTGRFKALDPDGDLLTFEITSAPKKGSVAPGDNASFVYTPTEKSRGKDTFSYVAVDENGGVSSAATITINLRKQTTKTTYADMDGSPAHYAAITLAERGVFTGEQLGGEYFFKPEDTVTRSEFLAMCLKTAGNEPISGITRTGFSDDADIPLWVKPYVSAGLMGGIVGGYKTDNGQHVFNPNAPITFSEAAVILNKTLGISDVTGVATVDTEYVPAWAVTAASNLSACNILPAGLSANAENTLTRADAAELLAASCVVLDARKDDKGLLAWAR